MATSQYPGLPAAVVHGRKKGEYEGLPSVFAGVEKAKFVPGKFDYTDALEATRYTYRFQADGTPLLVGIRDGKPVSCSRAAALMGGHKARGVMLSSPGKGDDRPTPWDFLWAGVDGFVPSAPVNRRYQGRTYDEGGLVAVGTSSGDLQLGESVIVQRREQSQGLPSLWELNVLPGAFAKGMLLPDRTVDTTKYPGESVLILGPASRWESQPGGVRRVRARLDEAYATGGYTRVVAAIDHAGVIIAMSERKNLHGRGDDAFAATVNWATSGVMRSVSWATKGIAHFFGHDIWNAVADVAKYLPVIGNPIHNGIEDAGATFRWAVGEAVAVVRKGFSWAEEIGIPPEAIIAVAACVAAPFIVAGGVGAWAAGGAAYFAGRQAAGGIARKLGLPAKYVRAMQEVLDKVALSAVTVASGGAALPVTGPAAVVMNTVEQYAGQMKAEMGEAIAKCVTDFVEAQVKEMGVEQFLRDMKEKSLDAVKAKLAKVPAELLQEAMGQWEHRLTRVWPSMGPERFVQEVRAIVEGTGATYADAFNLVNSARGAAVGVRDKWVEGVNYSSIEDLPELADVSRRLDKDIARAAKVAASVGTPALPALPRLRAPRASLLVAGEPSPALPPQVEAATDFAAAVRAGSFAAFNAKWVASAVVVAPRVPAPRLAPRVPAPRSAPRAPESEDSGGGGAILLAILLLAGGGATAWAIARSRRAR